ncbi:biotin-dependent carboxyltransferase family protein [Oceanobacillus sp. 1P07AA]|uniref:5-oxoprolinase subunit C family protein n=1 Tax=Oceanobacillus sp. 1P07AA TaxID=3132293 RepID=UPI0039A5E2F2
MVKCFEVIKPGLATSVQDLGRAGYQQYGVVVSGAMDAFALQVANVLVGNERTEAGLEIVIMGPKIKILEDIIFSIGGADLSAKLDNQPIHPWRSYKARKGQVLTFGQPVHGSYAYLAVAGGIDVPTVMGSKSTFVKAGLGGFHGRYLQKGDILKNHDSYGVNARSGRQLKYNDIPDYDNERPIRVIKGPDQQLFSSTTYDTFFASTYKMSSQSDRMGYRLEGESISHICENSADIISDAILPGTIQVPANGQPIILLADRQTTGGYARIATVISVDLPQVIQRMSGATFTFELISLAEAQQLYKSQESFLRYLAIS